MGVVLTGLAALSLLLTAACGGGGGGGGIVFNPGEETPTRIESSDGRIIAIIPPAALTEEADLSLDNRTGDDRTVPGPVGRTLVMAFEFTATVEPVEEETTEEDTGDDGGSTTSQAGDTDTETEVILAESVEVTLLLDSALPAGKSIPIYTYNATSERYEDAEFNGTVSETGAELVLTLDDFGRYAFYSLLPEEIAPAAPSAPVLVAASTQVRKLSWAAVAGGIIAGANLYRSSAGGDSFTKLNADPLTVTEWVDELPDPSGYDYYLTVVNTADLESDPSPVLSSPAVDFDIIDSWGWDRMQAPGDIALSAARDMLLICDPPAHCVWVYGLDGRYRERITSHGNKDLLEPTGVAFNPDGTRLYITDAAYQRVWIYDAGLDAVTFFGTPGDGPGEFERPVAIEVVNDPAVIGDIVLVVDEARSNLQSFTGLGVYLDTLASLGTGDGQLDTPGAIFATDANTVYISDSANDRVQVFNSDLEYEGVVVLTVEQNGPLSSPLGIELDFRERLYVADSGNRRVVVFDSSGERLFHFGADGDLRVEFSETTGPHGLALDPTTGYLYVSDTGNKRIVVFSS